MARCERRAMLEICYVNPNHGSHVSNARVLCPRCNRNTSSYTMPDTTPPPFSDETKAEALKRAGNQCECTKPRKLGGCH